MDNKKRKNFPGKVAYVMDEFNVVINMGSQDGINEGDKFLIYGATPNKEIKDPDTGEFLGYIPEPKGEGVAVIVEEHMSFVKSSEREPLKRPGQLVPLQVFAGLGYFPGQEKPFKNPKVGDKAKPIK